MPSPNSSSHSTQIRVATFAHSQTTHHVPRLPNVHHVYHLSNPNLDILRREEEQESNIPHISRTIYPESHKIHPSTFANPPTDVHLWKNVPRPTFNAMSTFWATANATIHQTRTTHYSNHQTLLPTLLSLAYLTIYHPQDVFDSRTQSNSSAESSLLFTLTPKTFLASSLAIFVSYACARSPASMHHFQVLLVFFARRFIFSY